MATKAEGTQAKADPKTTGKEISVEPVRPGLHEVAEGITCPVWRISPDRSARSLLRLLRISRGSGVYVKLPADRVDIPEEVSREMEACGEADEAAVFLSTHMGHSSVEVLLALRYSDQWCEVGRWKSHWAQMRVSRNEICEL